MLTFYSEIAKVDPTQRMVYGYASTEALDGQGERVSKDAMRAAWSDYIQWANVREMHQPKAAGIVKEYSFDQKGTWIGAKIVDDVAWNKVVEKVYKGFSIGGKKLGKDGDLITKLKLTEISLVDRPANSEARIELFKLEDDMAKEKEPAATLPADGELLAKVQGAYDKLEEVITKLDPVFADLAAATATSAAAKAEAAELRKIVEEQKASNDALVKRLEALEAQPKDDGAVVNGKAIAKSGDGGTKSDDPPADALALIKKVHAEGAQLLRF